AAFLHRITGAERISLGIYFHNRRGFRDTIGLLMHVHPLRVTVDEDDSFQSLIKKTQSEYLKILKYREYPIANPLRNPVYDVLINYVNTSHPSQLNGATAQSEWLNTGYGTESINIEFDDYESTGRFGLGIRFHEDVFNETQQKAAIRHFLQILDSYLADSSKPIALAGLLTDEERRDILVKFNQTRWEYPRNITIVEQFENQVEQTPDKIAVVIQEQVITYRQLNTRANQLAHYLRKLGIGPESLVGLLAERSIELEIGMLGILKAGAAFVPCDPDYPQERVQFILEDGGASVLLTQQRLAQNLSGHMARLICLDSDWDSVASESGENAVNGLTTDNIAYVIYTSGSTGRPKGTMIQQGSLFDYNQTATHEYGVTPDDRILQFCSLGFDISIEEIIPCLTHGATLVFRTDEMLETIPTFLQTCQQWDITMMSLPTAFWHEMTEGIDAFSLPLYEGLRLVIIAGEKVLPEKLSIWQRHVGNGAQLINTYGLTESTIISTAIDLTSLTLEGRESREVPIGCAIRNTQMYVLDKNLEPVPGSMPGELYIGGRLLSRGYYQRPELTAQRFVPNPYSDEPGTRLYKTGDLARFLSDASLEFLGRADRQVKIRGFRVELEEIAANLRQHSGVRDCVVVLREDQPGHKQLVAYVVLRSQSVSSGDQLRAYLAQSLPDYMIPTAFVMLEALPVSPNGKVDLKALPAPDRSNLSLDKSYVAPRTAIEKELADIWGSVLGLDRVGIHDNYFDLGGDSIRSIQIRAKAQQHGLGFSIQHLFQHQTIEELAIVCAQQGGECGPIALTEPFSLITEEDRAKIPDGVEDAYPLARLQAGMLFHNLYHLNSDLYMDVSMAHLQLQCNVDALRAAIGKLISRHPILRTSFDLGGYSEPVQLVWSEAPVLLTVDDITDMSSDAQDRFLRQWLYEETRRQFDLTKPPLMRFHVHLRSEKTFQFTWSNHHAILDGWSMAVMLSELFQLYGAELSGKESKVGSPPAVPYREFVALEREVLNSEEAKNYLTDKVRDLVVTTLPRRPSLSSRPAVPDIQSFSLVPPLKLCEELKRLAATNSIPIKSFVLAAQMKVLSLITGQSDITTGMVMSGRPEVPDGDRVLGLFTNTVPMRLTLSGGTWIELVKQVFDAEAAVVPYRRFPISELKTIEGGQILFETMFNFTHFYLYKTVPRISGARIFDVKVRGASNYVFVTDCNMDISSPQFELAFSYDATLIDHEQAKAFSHCYLRALEAIAENPYGRYELMSALSPTEWEKIVVQWNSTSVDYPHEKLIHQLFEEQADRAPDARAITYEGQQLTYAELNRRANQLAHHLRKLGIGTDKLVAVVAERSIEMVVALFGILKAGGAYVPLDPSYPKDRLEFMLRDSGASLMLTQSHLLRFLPGLLVEQLCLDSDWSLIADEPSENLATVIDPENLVYMIYTSGSTGQPKGALNTHHGLHNRLLWMQQQYQLSDADQVMQKTPFSFDVSVWEFFWPLITGASLVLARPGGHQDGNYLVHLINDAQVTVLHFVPSMLQAFLDQPDVESCQSLRQVICSGEALSYEMQERFNERLSASLDNLYGPTEASIDVTFWHCRPDQTRSVPIGRPIANTQIYLLDPSLQPVPIGAPGELYIGGAGLARGYHARSNLTAQKFIPNPFSTGRLYRTGDIARYRSDGEIEYLGRSDHQVKIRGFRV
ncbi:MAG TPA: amino acid adenylation domain-containing protein, partial [Blastocatellia bacterium]|nr:amino acid adenylation domain-containing protein [Blastocatellia bacterium]